MGEPLTNSQDSFRLQCDDNELAQQLFGPHNENLHRIEKFLNVTIHQRGGSLQVEGEVSAAELAHKVLVKLYALLKKGLPVYREDIDRALKILASDGDADLTAVYKESVYIPAKRKIITPRSQNQRSYLEAIRTKDLTIAIGPAGTGKTYLAVAMAVQSLMAKEVSRIILSRPAVEAGERLGFLPGDMVEKVDPYLRPLYDALYDMLDYEKIIDFKDSGVIEVAPLAFMRGRTLNSSFIILDEAQNCTLDQVKMMLTRIGFGSKTVVAGDVTQTDLPPERPSGLIDAAKRLKKIKGVHVQYFDECDVVRHELVSRIIQAYNGERE